MEGREEERSPDYTGVAIAAAMLPLLFFFTHIGKDELGLNVSLSLGVNLFAVRLCWDLRQRVWFWCVIVVVLACHIPLVLMIKWPHEWVPAVALLPIGLADLLVTVGAVRLVQKLIKDPSDVEA